jgi:hypothetical protein
MPPGQFVGNGNAADRDDGRSAGDGAPETVQRNPGAAAAGERPQQEIDARQAMVEKSRRALSRLAFRASLAQSRELSNQGGSFFHGLVGVVGGKRDPIHAGFRDRVNSVRVWKCPLVVACLVRESADNEPRRAALLRGRSA